MGFDMRLLNTYYSHTTKALFQEYFSKYWPGILLLGVDF